MKFILQEAKKFILEERFILNEADAVLDYTTFLNHCKKILESIKEKLNVVENDTNNTQELKQLSNKILSETNGLILTAKNTNDADIIRGHVDRYLQKIDGFLGKIDPDYNADTKTELRQTVNNLKTKVNETETGKKAADTLRAAINDMHVLFTNFAENAASVSSKEDGSTFDKVDQKIILNNIYEDITKVSKYTEDEYNNTPYKTLISTTVEQLYNNLSADPFEFIKVCKAAHDGTFGKKVSEETVANFNADELRQDKADRLDWSKQYQQAGDKDKFWDKYYTTVWGNNAEKVKSLGDAFKQECIVLGFSQESNPFISFVKNYIIGKSFPITKSQYTAIHDVIANNGAISTTDLVKPAKPLKGGNMIIWYKDFYVKATTYEAVREYLGILGKLRLLDYSKLKALDASSMEPTMGKAYENLIANFGGDSGSMADAIYNIFIEEKSTNDILTKNSGGISCPDSPTSQKIRTLQDIKKLYNVLNVEASAKKTWSNESTNELVAAIKENGLFKGNSALWAKKFLTLIATIYATADQIASLQKESWWSKPTDGETVKIKQELEKHGADINMSQFNKIAKDFENEGWLK